MASVLISGLDLVGKTLLTKNLVAVLIAEGYDAIPNDHELVKTHLSKRALELMIEDPVSFRKGEAGINRSLEINSMLAMSFFIDSLFYKQPPHTVIVQDSYYQRVIAYNRVNNLPYISDVLAQYSDKLFEFDAHIFLTASIEERQRRFYMKGVTDALDQEVFSNPDHVRAIESELEGILQQKPNLLKIDSTNMKPEEVTEKSLKHVLAYVIPVTSKELSMCLRMRYR